MSQIEPRPRRNDAHEYVMPSNIDDALVDFVTSAKRKIEIKRGPTATSEPAEPEDLEPFVDETGEPGEPA